MNTTKRLPVFEKFIQDVRAAWAELQDTEARMKRVKVLLEGLVKDPTIQEHSKNWPSTEGHKNLLLYEDPDYQFVVNAVVRTPGALWANPRSRPRVDRLRRARWDGAAGTLPSHRRRKKRRIRAHRVRESR